MTGNKQVLKRAGHPGEILKDELPELSISSTEFARQIDVPSNRVSQIINGKRSITSDTALRLGYWFGFEPAFWLQPAGAFRTRLRRRGIGRAHSPSIYEGR